MKLSDIYSNPNKSLSSEELAFLINEKYIFNRNTSRNIYKNYFIFYRSLYNNYDKNYRNYNW